MMSYLSPDRPRRTPFWHGRTAPLLAALIPILLALSPFVTLLALAAFHALPEFQGGVDLGVMGP